MPLSSNEDATQTMKFVDSDNAFVVYCNSTQMGLTAWDIRFKLIEVFDLEGSNALSKNHGTVIMSPGHAKAFLEALQSTVKKYEDTFGEIDLAKIHDAVNVKSKK